MFCAVVGNNEMKVSGNDQVAGDWGGCCDPRHPATMGSGLPSMQPGSERAGIGIILALSPDGSLFVHTVCPGGSAQGMLLPGDVLLKIGSEDVYRFFVVVSLQEGKTQPLYLTPGAIFGVEWLAVGMYCQKQQLTSSFADFWYIPRVFVSCRAQPTSDMSIKMQGTSTICGRALIRSARDRNRNMGAQVCG